MKIRIVDCSKEYDNINYAYAVCECLLFGERIEISRPNDNDAINFNCPRCNKKLGLWMRGKKNLI